MKPKLLILVLLISGATGAQTTKEFPSNTSMAFTQLSLPDKMMAMKQMDPTLLKQQVDSICLAQKLIVKNDKGLAIDINKAIAENKLLVENGTVFYLQYGIPSPVAKQVNPLPNAKN